MFHAKIKIDEIIISSFTYIDFQATCSHSELPSTGNKTSAGFSTVTKVNLMFDSIIIQHTTVFLLCLKPIITVVKLLWAILSELYM